LDWHFATASTTDGFSPGPPNLTHPDAPVDLSCPVPEGSEGGWLVFRAAFDPAGLVDALLEIRFSDKTRTFLRPTLVGRNAFYGALKARVPVAEAILHTVGSNGREPETLRFGPETSRSHIIPLIRRALYLVIKHPGRLSGSTRWFMHRLMETKVVHLPPRIPVVAQEHSYAHWIDLLDERPEEDRALHEQRLAGLTRRPLITVLAVASGEEEARRIAADMPRQIYPDWELIVTVPQPVAPDEIRPAATRFVEGPASDRGAGLNRALAETAGEIVVALPPGGSLRAHALLECAMAFAVRPQTAMLYADEDVLDADGRRTAPRFKPAWSPEAEATHDYIGDPAFFATGALRQAGGWRAGLGEAADHDLKLRITEGAPASAVLHLAKVLLHRRSSAAGRIEQEALVPVIADHLRRTGTDADVVIDERSRAPRIVRRLSDPPLVSMIIPTRDRGALLKTCLTSILTRTAYPRLEVIIVDNDSREPETKAVFEELTRDPRVRILGHPGPFNFSALNNAAAREAKGSVLALVNNDIEVIAEDWLHEMVGYAADERIGCVGAKLYYPGGTLQHGSVVVGLGGGAGHVHKHAPRDMPGYLDRLTTVQNVTAVTAACLVVRKAVYEEVGGLDERVFEVAFNDVDFCLKVARAGYRNVWTPFAELVHHESISRGDDMKDRAKARRFAAELAALQERWGTALMFDPYYSPHLEWQTESVGIRLA
jgi:GT2 family glycosyltransferase